jgi:hypothetical protein
MYTSLCSKLSAVLLVCLSGWIALAQQSAGTPAAAVSEVVPNLVGYNGILKDSNGKIIAGTTGVTFLLYKEEQGGAPIWLETQNVTSDKSGHYAVQLGANSAHGLGSDLFMTGEAHWVAVQVGSEAEQPRVLLVAVPYAMKAADAQTLGGLPPSAFVQAPTGGAAAKATGVTSVASSPSAPPPATSNVTTTGGSAQHLAMFTKVTNIQNSIVSQTGTTAIDVTGKLGVNTLTPSQSLDVSSGNAIVRGAGNFTKAGNTATLYIGDLNHPIEATNNSGLSLGAFKAPQALFIADFTGNVGIGTTKPTTGILNSVANSSLVVGLSAAGWSAPSTSISSGTDGAHLTGGNSNSAAGGGGVVATGGTGDLGGPGINATGGSELGQDASAGDGIDAQGGSGEAGGIGLIASAGAFEAEGTISTGSGSRAFGVGGSGVAATGGPGDLIGGDGIVAVPGQNYTPGGPPGLAGDFSGDVSITGNLSVSGTKHFRIDHPLDPANKYLYHAALESSEVLNLYSGNTTLNASGEVTIQLPDWFQTLNRDFRYQLTAIGAAAPNLHIAQKIENNKFKIAGGSAGLEVSWQVTGVRQDAWERAHPMAVEVAKSEKERGYYLNPELFGAPKQRGIDWARHPQLMKRIEGIVAKQKKQASQRQALVRKLVRATQP